MEKRPRCVCTSGLEPHSAAAPASCRLASCSTGPSRAHTSPRRAVACRVVPHRVTTPRPRTWDKPCPCLPFATVARPYASIRLAPPRSAPRRTSPLRGPVAPALPTRCRGRAGPACVVEGEGRDVPACPPGRLLRATCFGRRLSASVRWLQLAPASRLRKLARLFFNASRSTLLIPMPALPKVAEFEADTPQDPTSTRAGQFGLRGRLMVRSTSYLLDSLPVVVVLVGGPAVSTMLRLPPTALRLSAGEAREHVFAIGGRRGGCVGVRGVEGGGGGAGGFWESAEEMAGVGWMGFDEARMVGGVRELDEEESEDNEQWGEGDTVGRIESASEAESEGLYDDPSCGGGVEWGRVDGTFEGRDGLSGMAIRRRVRSWSSPATGSSEQGRNEEMGTSVDDETDGRPRQMAGHVDGRFAVMEGSILVDEAEELTGPAIGSDPTAPSVDESQQGTVRRSVRRRRAETLFGHARHSSEPVFPEYRAQKLTLANHLDQAVDNSRPPQLQTLDQSVNSSVQEGRDPHERSVQSMRSYDGSRLDCMAQHYQMMRRGAGAESFETPRSARSVHGLRMPMFGSAVETPPHQASLAGEETLLLGSRQSHLSEVPQLSLNAVVVEGLDGFLEERLRATPRSMTRSDRRQPSQILASGLNDWAEADQSAASNPEQQVTRSTARTVRPSRGSAFEIYEDTGRGAEIARERRAGVGRGWRYHRLRDSPENVLAPEHSREHTRLGEARRAFLAMSLEEGGGVLVNTPPRVGRYDRLGQSDPDIESLGQGDGE